MGKSFRLFWVAGFALTGALWWEASLVFAGHPLITDDAGVQGRGGFQIEFNGMLSHNKDGGVTERSRDVETILSYGFLERADLVLGIPFQYTKSRTRDGMGREKGLSDLILEVKWRFYEGDGFGLAFKPGVTLPAGNEKRGRGTGKPTYGSAFIVTKEMAPWSIHFNLGYKRYQNKLHEREDTWQVSLASEWKIFPGLKLVSNIGGERNTDRASHIHPAFIIGGGVYSVTENVEFNFGVQVGLTRPATDYTIHPGLVFRFNFQ